MIHSVDSIDLLKRLDGAAAEAGAEPEILLQADLAGKPPNTAPASRISPRSRAALESRAVKLAGLMLLPLGTKIRKSPGPGSCSCAGCAIGWPRTEFRLNRSHTCPWG